MVSLKIQYNIYYFTYTLYPGVAQLVARLTGGQEAAGSSPVTRTKTLETSVFQGFLLFLQT